MTQAQHDLIQGIIDKVENARRWPTGGYDRRRGATVTLTRKECDELEKLATIPKARKRRCKHDVQGCKLGQQNHVHGGAQ